MSIASCYLSECTEVVRALEFLKLVEVDNDHVSVKNEAKKLKLFQIGMNWNLVLQKSSILSGVTTKMCKIGQKKTI